MCMSTLVSMYIIYKNLCWVYFCTLNEERLNLRRQGVRFIPQIFPYIIHTNCKYASYFNKGLVPHGMFKIHKKCIYLDENNC